MGDVWLIDCEICNERRCLDAGAGAGSDRISPSMSVLVLIREQREIAGLIRWGQRFAHARDTSLQILYLRQSKQAEPCTRLPVLPDANEGDSIVTEIRRILDEERSTRLDTNADTKKLDTHKSELPGLWQVADPRPLAVVLNLIQDLHAGLLLLGKSEQGRHAAVADIGTQLLHQASCDVMVLRPGIQQGQQCRRIVVPVAGGPHSIVALRLADQLARQQDAQVVILNIQPQGTADAEAQGRYHIQQIMQRAGVSESAHLELRVESGNDVKQIINKVAHQDCDLVMLGTSDHSAVGKMLFGTIYAHVMAHEEGTGVAVLRRARPLHSRLRMWIERFAHQQIPQLDRKERIELSEQLTNGSICSFDYLGMMFLSTAIAALGLLQNSTAVVVGAMLVAPLMTPIIGAGLSLVQGNVVLARHAAKSVGLGFLLALLVSMLIAAVTPGVSLNHELLGRGNPNTLDLAIAFFSGIAAAYALSRPNLSAALPGVAIAAALLPPVATIGIALVLGAFDVAQGAVLLFGANVVAIIIGSALILHLVGLRSAAESVPRIWVSRSLLVLLMLFLVLAIPLSSVILARISLQEMRSLKDLTIEELHDEAAYLVHQVLVEEGETTITVRAIMIGEAAVSAAQRQRLEQRLNAACEKPVILELRLLRTELLE